MPFLAPILTAAGAFLSRLLFSRLGMWLATALVFIGIEFAAIGVAIPSFRDAISGNLGGLPGELVQWMGVLNLDVYLTVILSAYAAAHAKKAIMRRRTAP